MREPCLHDVTDATAYFGAVDFVDPDWDAPLDVEAYLGRVPADETMKGMFLIPVVKAAADQGHPLPSARERYLPFHDYPLREHMMLLLEASRVMWPRESARRGLRRLGRGAIRVLLESTVGRVLWASATSPALAVTAAAKAYAITQPRTVVRITESRPRAVVVRIERVYSFLDCHHIGVFESALKGVGAEGVVKIRRHSLSEAELLCAY